MLLQRHNFPPILGENEATYLRYLQAVIEAVDRDAQALVTKKMEGVSVRISPSTPNLFPLILSQIKKYHRLIGLELDFSKSMKAGHNIYFNINFLS